MNANNVKKINGNLIEEFYWCGRFVCYVNNKLSDKTFEEEVERLSSKSVKELS